MVYFNTKSSWISVGEKKKTTNGMGGHFWSSTSKGKKKVLENDVMAWKENQIRGSLFFFFIIVMENDVLIPKRAAALVGFVSCGKFSNLLCCLASVWKRADNTHHLKGHNDDSKLFYFPSKFFFSSWPRLNFFFFISCFSSIFIIEGEEEKK
jgi:hypothetical protein